MGLTTVDRLAAIIADIGRLPPDEPITADTRLVGGGIVLDSVAVLELLVALEREFGIELSADDLLKENAIQTVGTLAAFVDRKANPCH